MRILFLGSGEFGLPTLRALAEHHTVTGVVTQPDKPAGRSRRPTATPIGAWASANLPGVPLFKPDDVNTPDQIEALHRLPADAWVVIAFGQKLSPALLADRFAINLHASLLPRWRGAAPINRAVMAGDARTGNSVITLADRMDAGLVLGTSERPIDPLMTAGELHDALAADGPELVLSVLSAFECDALKPIHQNEAGVTQARKLSRADGWVDFSAGADECRRRIHGLTPWPGVTVRFRDEAVRLRRVATVHAASLETALPLAGTTEKSAPGNVVDARTGVVACGDGTALQLLELQPAGRDPMRWIDFANGRRVQPGERFIGGPEGAGLPQ